ncbi:MAG: hypothetical protein EB059_00890 [Alphaproteobacteria bacterium]|nr:hypothetical protein [Alphaproteobacteria bacterium]
MRIQHILIALLLMIGFSGIGHADSDFTKSAIRMGTTTCSDSNFECNNLLSQQKEITSTANECVKNDFLINDAAMTDFKMSGEFENCVLSAQAVKDSRGTNNYAVCCIKKSPSSDMCRMTCTRYIDQK